MPSELVGQIAQDGGMTVAITPSVETAYCAVVEFFPHRELAIRRLLITDESFREICGELCEAKAALARCTEPFDENGENRRAEWHDLVGRLVAEVLTVLIAYDASLKTDRRYT